VSRRPALLHLHPGALRFRAAIGTGGIGTGSFFQLAGNHTLGREESRGGRFLDRRDYCKLHIVCHYLKALFGEAILVYPVGRVGDDEAGRRLLREMAEAGLEKDYLEALPERSTLFSFCFLYPDGTGGNLSTEDSACAAVDAPFVRRAQASFAAHRDAGLALALPEVPLPARKELLELAGRHGFFRAASFTAGEIEQAWREGFLAELDLLALNAEEARTLLACTGAAAPSDPIAPAGVAAQLAARFPGLWLSVTAGVQGSWSWDGGSLRHLPAPPVKVVTTAGAGDAHLAGLLAGVAASLDLEQAQRLATLVAAASVSSPHTIHKEVSRAQLAALGRDMGWLDGPLGTLLGPVEHTGTP
jgi:ribokinase